MKELILYNKNNDRHENLALNEILEPISWKSIAPIQLKFQPYLIFLLAEIQSGIIQMMKTILSIGGEDKDLELGRPSADVGYFVVELLQATLFDPATVEAALRLVTFRNEAK